MIVPGELDITIYQNASWDMPVEWLVDGQRYDFTDQVVAMQVRPEYESGVIVAELTVENGYIELRDAGLGLYLWLPPSVTALMPMGRYVYDIRVGNLSSAIRPLRGKCFVDPAVTR